MQAADDILTVSLGDEIGVAGTSTDVGFISFLESRHQTPTDVGCILATQSWTSVLALCNKTTGVCPVCGQNSSIANAVDEPTQKLYYFSRLYSNEAGLQVRLIITLCHDNVLTVLGNQLVDD